MTVIISALIAAAVSLAIPYFSQKMAVDRERVAEWRKIRLGLYQEYILAISGLAEGRLHQDRHNKYLDATHSLMLFAPAKVVKIAVEFNRDNLNPRHLTDLFEAIRDDISPGIDLKSGPINFQLFKFQSLDKSDGLNNK